MDFSDFYDSEELRKKIAKDMEELLKSATLFSQFRAEDSPFGSMRGSFTHDFNFQTESCQGSAVDEEKVKAHWVRRAAEAYRETKEKMEEGDLVIGFDPSGNKIKVEKIIQEDKIIACGLNTETAKKWLPYSIPDGNSDGKLLGIPFAVRTYNPPDVLILVRKKRDLRIISMLRIIEAQPQEVING
jgi:hypothetical protein